MAATSTKPVRARTRALIQVAKFSIRDVFDAITELVTNADDRYQHLGVAGLIEIEVERHRGREKSLVRVRDFADGMNQATMDEKLSWMGGRESGLSDGEDVRGTHSRGAKDIAALGHVSFESIAADGKYHKCEITPFLDFVAHESREATSTIRQSIGIASGSGTLVTIQLDKAQQVPQQGRLAERIEKLVSLRKILGDANRTVILRDLVKGDEVTLSAPRIEGTDRVKETMQIPGYPGVTAKLIIRRAPDPFPKSPARFREGGILIESRRAVHEATLFDGSLDSDANSSRFFGRLVCHHIDALCDEFDDCFERRSVPGAGNPTYVLDPSRKSGLNRDHPFTKALFAEALKRLRPLVAAEQRLAETERARVESAATRKRLNALEKAALEFIEQFENADDIARDPDGKQPESRFLEKGYALSPPFSKMVKGHTRLFWLTIRQETFPEVEPGSNVQIECLTDDIQSTKKYCGLEHHPTRDGALRAVWKVTANKATTATGIRIRVGPITAEAYMEIIENEADMYANVGDLEFKKKTYRIRTNQKSKRVTILAPLEMVSNPARLQVEVDSQHFTVSGDSVLRPNKHLGVAVCELSIKSDAQEAKGTILASLEGRSATAEISSHRPLGSDLSIRLEDVDLGNQRYRWKSNVLELAARHPSLSRYLGSKEEGFPGQEELHFRVFIAEVVSDAICAMAVRRNVQSHPEDYEDADWDMYYADYSRFMTQFLPIAHKLVCSRP